MPTLPESINRRYPLSPGEYRLRQLRRMTVGKALYAVRAGGETVARWYLVQAGEQPRYARFALRGPDEQDVLHVESAPGAAVARAELAVMTANGAVVGRLARAVVLIRAQGALSLRDPNGAELAAFRLAHHGAPLSDGRAEMRSEPEPTSPGCHPTDVRTLLLTQAVEWPLSLLVLTAPLAWALREGAAANEPGAKPLPSRTPYQWSLADELFGSNGWLN